MSWFFCYLHNVFLTLVKLVIELPDRLDGFFLHQHIGEKINLCIFFIMLTFSVLISCRQWARMLDQPCHQRSYHWYDYFTLIPCDDKLLQCVFKFIQTFKFFNKNILKIHSTHLQIVLCTFKVWKVHYPRMYNKGYKSHLNLFPNLKIVATILKSFLNAFLKFLKTLFLFFKIFS